jgi:glycosyltransferase involved in cell wall biosynthesis
MARVTVVVPAYRAEAFIADTLRSIAEQTYRDWEAVVVDDASPDGTYEVAAAFGGPVRALMAPRNAGPAAARNLALADSESELVAFLDADDAWLPDFLEHQVALYDERTAAGRRVGVVGCNAYLRGPDGRMELTWMDHNDIPDVVTLAGLLVANPVIVSSALVPRAAIEAAGDICEDIRGTEDFDLWLRLVELGYEVVLTREPLVLYTVADASVSSDLGGMSGACQLTDRRALDRGNLSPKERRVAERKLRLQRGLERLEELLAVWHARDLKAVPLAAARAFPLLLASALEHPHRWPYAVRFLAGGRRGIPRSAA